MSRIACLLLTALLGGAALAHHSLSGQFDTARTFEITGVVSRDEVGLHAALRRRWSLADLEHEYIRLALEWTEGRKTEAADLLQIDRKTLYRKLAEYAKAKVIDK